MGAWIETFATVLDAKTRAVAPYMGAWIETHFIRLCFPNILSHPTWVRGLKPQSLKRYKIILCRTLHGCVD